MRKFKVGDRVRIKSLRCTSTGHSYHPNQSQGLVVGNTGTVGGLYGEGRISVLTDNAEEPSDPLGDGWFFFEDGLELLDTESETA